MATETTPQTRPTAENARQTQTFVPHVDILENPNELLVLADLPGVEPDQLDIQFEDGTLTLHGKVKPRGPEDGHYLMHEYGIGDFYRSFRINEEIDVDGIAAELSAGVLTLRLPKSEAAKPRKIAVKAS